MARSEPALATSVTRRLRSASLPAVVVVSMSFGTSVPPMDWVSLLDMAPSLALPPWTRCTDPDRSASDLSHPAHPWGPVEVFDRLGSTNDEVRERPAPWRVVVAEQQDAGRGRLGRAWTTTPGTALAVSVLVPPPASGASWVPLLAGLAVHRAVEEVAGVVTALKWPNDVLVPGDDDRKLAGLLCEWTEAGVVVGLGLNVDTARGDLPLDTATSLRAAGAPGVDRAALLDGLPRAPGPGAGARTPGPAAPPRPPTSRPAPRWAARSRCTSRAAWCAAVSRQASTMRAD